MKKQLTTLLVLLTITTGYVSAQIGLNVYAGPGISFIENRNQGNQVTLTPLIGVETLFLKINNKASIGSGLIYHSQGYKNINDRTLNINYLSIPVLIKTVYENGITNSAGISYTGLISSNERFVPIVENSEVVNEMAQLKDGHISFVAEFGYQFKNSITTGIKWQFNITGITHNLYYKYQSIHLTIGYKISL